MARLFMALLFALLPAALAQGADPFNTYRWNRDNVLRRNGVVDKGPWFEWWYYKVVMPDTGESFYFVYGVVNPWDTAHTQSASRAYVGMGDFSAGNTLEQSFPVADFQASYEQADVRVGDNQATDTQVRGSITGDDGHEASWDFRIAGRWAFNAVSWVTGQGITNIEWYPAQADARCSGRIVSHGKARNFENAPCYQDRNWGRSFPQWWTWIVSNHFRENPDSALAIGGGKPKVFGAYTPVEGVAIGLRHKGVVHTFRPNEFNPVRCDVRFGRWEVSAENPSHRIEVSAWAPPESFLDLQFVTPQGETFHDYETLTGKLKVSLYRRAGLFGWKLEDTLTSDFAGIEYGSRDEYGLSSLFQTAVRRLQ